jgi:hypothetical protein
VNEPASELDRMTDPEDLARSELKRGAPNGQEKFVVNPRWPDEFLFELLGVRFVIAPGVTRQYNQRKATAEELAFSKPRI